MVSERFQRPFDYSKTGIFHGERVMSRSRTSPQEAQFRSSSVHQIIGKLARLLGFIFIGVIGVLGIATSAGAYIASHGTGSGATGISTLNAPIEVLVSLPNSNEPNVSVSWTAPTEPSGITLDGYYVQSNNGSTTYPSCGTSPTSLISTITCNDADVPPGTYTYTVTAVFRSWTATSAPSGPITIAAPQLSSFELTPSTSTPTAGSGFTVGITALDQYGNVYTPYTGPECLTFTGPLNSPNDTPPSYPVPGPCSSGSEVTFVNGIATGPNAAVMILYDAQGVTLTATDNPTSIDGTTDLTVLAGSVTSFDVANPGTQTVGVPFDDSITAVDQYGNTVTAYTGAQDLTFTGPSNSPNSTTPTYPSSVSFADGVGSATGITLVDAETTALTATQDAISGTSTDFLVNAGPASSVTSFDVANPGTQTVGVPFDDSITAVDQYGNTVTAYTGAQDLTFTGPSNSPNSTTPTYPSSVSFADGVGSATGITLVDAETTSLTATQDTVTGTSTNFPVDAGTADYYSIGVPPAATVDVSFPVTITALDSFGNVATSYNGTAGLVAASGEVSPVTVTLSNGTVTFMAALNTPGNQTITATDTLDSSLTQVSGVIVVSSGVSSSTYSVTYNKGTATSGSVPVDPNSPYAAAPR